MVFESRWKTICPVYHHLHCSPQTIAWISKSWDAFFFPQAWHRALRTRHIRVLVYLVISITLTAMVNMRRTNKDKVVNVVQILGGLKTCEAGKRLNSAIRAEPRLLTPITSSPPPSNPKIRSVCFQHPPTYSPIRDQLGSTFLKPRAFSLF